MFGDEASFWLDGTLHQTWSRVGVQPRVDTFGERKTAHVFGAVSLEKRPRFLYEFADVFNGRTFLGFLQQIVRRSRRRKVFLVIDNGPCHNLDEDGKAWLAKHRHRLELFRLPPYSPEYNAHRGRLAHHQEADDAQHVLPNDPPAGRSAQGDLRDLPVDSVAARRTRRTISMIPSLRDSV